MTSLDWDILINQVAQGVRAAAGGGATYDALSEDERRSILRRVNVLALQAGARDADAAAAIARSGVRPTRTAAVLMAAGRVDIQLAKVAMLPAAELSEGV